jgi:hypothetical protein
MDDIDEVEIEIEHDIESVYKEECGYFIVILMRGNTTGRRLKRTIFKSGIAQLSCGFSLMMLAIGGGYLESMNKYFIDNVYGASIHDLQWLVSFPSILFGIGSMIMIYYWASLCTNRTLLKSILNIYMCVNLFFFIFVFWLLCALGLSYRRGNVDWRNKDLTNQIFACVFFQFVFTVIYFVTILQYTLDISYFSEELEYEGIRLLEPYEPEVDLSEMNLSVACVEAFAVPCTYIIQAFDMFMACYRQILRYMAYRRRKAIEHQRERDKIKNTIWHRLRKTRYHLYYNYNISYYHYYYYYYYYLSLKLYTMGLAMYNRYKERYDDYRRNRQEQLDKEEEMKLLQKSAAINEKMERERQQLEEERKKRLEHEMWKKQIEEDHRKEQEEIARQEREIKQKAEEEEKAMKSMPTLSVQQFKSYWTSLGTSGQFQCKLKSGIIYFYFNLYQLIIIIII